MCLRALGEHIIVLDSAKAVTELFERRSAIYSDRPKKPVLDMCVRLSPAPWPAAVARMHRRLTQLRT